MVRFLCLGLLTATSCIDQPAGEGSTTSTSLSRFDKDGDGVRAEFDCDDKDARVGELLYYNNFQDDDGEMSTTAALPDAWMQDGGLAANERGGQQALLAATSYKDTVTFTKLRGNGMERKCTDDCAFSVRHAEKVGDSSAGHAFWFNGLYGAGNFRMKFKTGARFRFDRDAGVATLRGTAVVYLTPVGHQDKMGQEWAVDMEWAHRGRGAAGEGIGGPKRERARNQPISVTDQWEYFDMTHGELSTEDGHHVSLVQFPANSRYPLQVGTWANNKNHLFGGSSWFTFTHVLPSGQTFVNNRGDINVEFHERDRFRAGILARANVDRDQDEGFHGYRCAVARNSEVDCHKPGRFVQLASFLDGPEDNINSECDNETCPANTTFKQLARSERSDRTDVLNGDKTALTFWAVGEELVCEFEGNMGEKVTARGTDSDFKEGTTGLSLLNLHTEYAEVKVCEALAAP